jgi:hypothetical protein
LLYNLGRLLFILDHSTAEAEHALRCSLWIITDVESESRERDIVTVQTLLLIIQEQRERESDAVGIALLRALVHQQSEFGYENCSVAKTLCQLGEVYTRWNQHEHAVMFLSKALRVQRQIGVSSIKLLLTLSQLGWSLHHCGHHAEALSCMLSRYWKRLNKSFMLLLVWQTLVVDGNIWVVWAGWFFALGSVGFCSWICRNSQQ